MEYVKDFLYNCGIFPVEIRLLLSKEMEIIFVKLRDILPGTAAEDAGPVGRLLSVLSLSEDIVVMIGAVFVGKGGLEPGVLIRGMVSDKVHHEFHAPLMDAGDHLLKVLHGAEGRIDIAVIRHVIASVCPRAYKEGRGPNDIHPEGGDIIKLLGDASEVSGAVSV